jgi:hypothetical protein
MNAFTVLHLPDENTVDLRDHLDGSWGPVSLIQLDVDETYDLDATASEICVFVIEGGGDLTMGSNVAQARTGTGVTVTLGGSGTLTADRPTQLFAARLTV